MTAAAFSMGEEYWEAFQLRESDIEFLYNYLLELETPLTARELLAALVEERIQEQKRELQRQRTASGDLYQPKDTFRLDQNLVFPALGWKKGRVTGIRPGLNPQIGEFQVIQVALEDGTQREFASGLKEHKLNAPPQLADDFEHLDRDTVLKKFGDRLLDILESGLSAREDFVRIAGRWFPRALLMDIHIGHLNLAEAVLDMAGGGPLATVDLMKEIGLSEQGNPKLAEFSLDLALQEDGRFDEVGPAGKVLWYLRRLEPPEVLNPPIFLRYQEIEHDRSVFNEEMRALEQSLDDELSPPSGKIPPQDEVEVRLIYPHWQSGTLPLSSRLRHLFPTAYEAPRVRFMLVDGESGEKFPGWVVRERRYVYGLQEWYEEHNAMPGSLVRVRRGDQPGEVVVHIPKRRPSREWVRTVLVGSDGGIVFAMLKQIVSTPIDERMAIAVPDRQSLEQIWQSQGKDQTPFEKIAVNMVRELARLNPQGHVHASELYAAINIVRRTPPGPILWLLASRPWFIHVGDQHYRLSDADL